MNSTSELHSHLVQLSKKLLDALGTTPYTPSESTTVDTKATLRSLLSAAATSNSNVTELQLHDSIKDFALAIAIISSASSHDLLSWIPRSLSAAASSAFADFSVAYCASVFGERNERRVGELLGLECGLVSEEKRVVVELMPEVLPLLKERIKESSIDKSADGDEVSAASARAPVGSAILAAYQFKWFVTQVHKPHLGKLSTLVIPCALTVLDHWSPDVKGQGMITFIHIAKNVNVTELCYYEDVILDACCQNIASADEIWHLVVEMSVLLVTSIQQSNARSPWFERILNDTIGHLERQPRNKERRIAWLTCIEPLFLSVGLVLLSHFRRIFPLFFKWMHADDDETILLVLKRLQTIIRLTWIRNSPYFERLVDELVALQKEAALKTAREEIRRNIVETMVLLQQSKGLQFEAAWNKHKGDPNMTTLCVSLSGDSMNDAAAQA